MVDDIFGVEIEEQADIVIATAGGYPKDINLYQTQKTIDNAVYAMKPGGVVVTSSTPYRNIPDYPDLGQVLAEQESPDLFAIEERIRSLAKRRRAGDRTSPSRRRGRTPPARRAR